MKYLYCISGRSSSNFREYLQRRLGEIKQKQRTKAGPSTAKYGMKIKGPNNQKLGRCLQKIDELCIYVFKD